MFDIVIMDLGIRDVYIIVVLLDGYGVKVIWSWKNVRGKF